MIKTAYLSVLVVAGLLAFGVFALVRGTGGGSGPVASGPATTPPVTEEPAPVAKPQAFYFLAELVEAGAVLDDGAAALVMFGASADGTPLVVRDATALSAAQTDAVITYTSGKLALSPQKTPAAATFAQVYRDDRLVAAIICPDGPCADLVASGAMDDAGLLQAAASAVRIQDSFDTYEAYLATIDAIATDPDFMLLDARPASGFPAPQMIPSLQLALPTVVTSAQAPLDVALHGTLVAEAALGALPDGVTITDVTVTPLPPALLGDRDNSQPLLLNGTPIAFDRAGFYAVDLVIQGRATLDDATLTAITAATTLRHDYTADFDSFVAARVQTDCADCVVALPPDRFTAQTEITQSNPALYTLTYYDLREAP